MTDDYDFKILVVDDEPINLTILVKMLRKAGYSRVRTAEDGAGAIAALEADLPDLVILDVVMPDIDGFALCQQLRSFARYATLPILLHTALDNRETLARLSECGADGMVTKPIEFRELQARVDAQRAKRG